jgi:S-layer homology domain.
MRSKIVSFALIATFVFGIVQPGAFAADSQTTFIDVPQSHWAASAIAEAVQAGYVSGYPDGTFKPDQVVTREEFIKMAVEAFGLDTSRYKAPDMWSLPYLAAAVENGWIAPDEYDYRKDKLIPPEGYKDRGARMASFQKKDGNLLSIYADTAHYPMPRHEMAKVAINALGKSVENTGKDWEYKNAVMRQAVNLGLIHGMGNGNLAPDGTTTRAQAVVVIQRMLTLKNGGTLPVDPSAQEAAKKDYDPWGRTIRTTNLPKNASDFPYILEGIPNEMYEMPFIWTHSKSFQTPKQFAETGEFTKEDLDQVLERIEKAYHMILNVDYRAIDPETWGKELRKLQASGNPVLEQRNIEYAKWVVENKISIEGYIDAEPSMAYVADGSGWFVRAKFKFKINSYDKKSNKLLYDYLFEEFYREGGFFDFEKGVWNEGYTDIMFATNHYGGNPADSASINANTSLFMNYVINGRYVGPSSN